MDVFSAWSRLWYELECLDSVLADMGRVHGGLVFVPELRRDFNPVLQRRVRIVGRPYRVLAHRTGKFCGVAVCYDGDPRFAVAYGTEMGLDLWCQYWSGHFRRASKLERKALEAEVGSTPTNLPKAEQEARIARERAVDVERTLTARGARRFFSE